MVSQWVRSGIERYRGQTFFGILIFLLLVFPLHARGEGYLNVTFLDVGEGEAIYLDTPTNENILIDTGSPVTGYRVVDFLKDRGVKTLNALFITHPHPDHMGGIFHILPRVYVKAVYDNGQPISEQSHCDIYRWYKDVARGKSYKVVKRGDTFSYGDVRIEVLWPPETLSSDWNENSLVLKLIYKNTAFLFMGDAGISVEEALLHEGVDLRAEVLKIGHHGAIDATSPEFLRAVSPEFVVISINKDNIRGYPHAQILKRLKTYKTKVLLTYKEGDITFVVDGEGISRHEIFR